MGMHRDMQKIGFKSKSKSACVLFLWESISWIPYFKYGKLLYFRDLLASVKVVEDKPSDRAMGLELSGKIKSWSKVATRL